MSWSPCGKYLAIGGAQNGAGYAVEILNFDGSSLSAVKSYDPYPGGSITVYSVCWLPCGNYLAIGGDPGTGGYDVRVFEVMDAPSGCLVDSNRTCNATSSNTSYSQQGIGICASGNNLCVRNVGSDNDVNFNKAVYNVYGASLLADNPKVFDNLWQPPYANSYGALN